MKKLKLIASLVWTVSGIAGAADVDNNVRLSLEIAEFYCAPEVSEQELCDTSNKTLMHKQEGLDLDTVLTTPWSRSTSTLITARDRRVEHSLKVLGGELEIALRPSLLDDGRILVNLDYRFLGLGEDREALSTQAVVEIGGKAAVIGGGVRLIEDKDGARDMKVVRIIRLGAP
ncbi:hypothetical protein [Congregibacter litoralis]|uniref:Uncharacterized protein n=1 Tax=Congregibacter litoralis KT71 TaxID=314285 RepID=A4A332_9GAMM|nr:hypothetical protein [Congregibacter litoralis]EAQ99132.1 hypothetical protein KT71_15721 [Congregibacter litoralis KT71]